MIKKLLLVLLVAILALGGVVAYRTAMFVPPALPRMEQAQHPVDASAVAARLSEAIRFQTISNQPPIPMDAAAFEGFIAWLEKTYPEAHAAMARERIGGHTLLFTWPGKNTALKPVLLTGHYDVVPVVPGTEGQWKHPPFEGRIAEGHVWGRGTLDDKGAVITMLEGATALLKQNFQPERTVYFSFGHDEEIGGRQGAGRVAAHLKAKNVRLEWSLDEGSFVLKGIVPGVTPPAASINVAEKGYLTLEIVARGRGGHSSMPPKETAVGVLAEAIVKLQKAPLPAKIDGIASQAFDQLARHMTLDKRVLFANQWLFGPLLEWALAQSPGTNAMIRTTTAPTMLAGSPKENVLPIEARATVNFRLHPRDNQAAVIAHVKKAIADERVEVIALAGGSDASAVSSSDSAAYGAIMGAVRRVYDDVVVAPGLTIAATDTKHYGAIAENAYRFNPMLIGPEDLTGFHGTNERLSLDNLVRATRFYIELLRTATGA